MNVGCGAGKVGGMLSARGSSVLVVDVAMDHLMVAPLVQAQQDEVAARYGGYDDSQVDVVQFFPPRGAFFMAVVDGQPVGCAGLRSVPEHDAVGRAPAVEIKRMYTSPAARRRGVAVELLTVLAYRARAMRCEWLLLETGDKQPEAVALYERFGFVSVSGFGHYSGYPGQISMAFDLGEMVTQRR